MAAESAVARRTERWFVRQGFPCLIEGYGFAAHVLPRMLPFLALTALASLAWLVPVRAGTGAELILLAALVIAAAAALLGLTRFGRRLPRVSPRATIAILVAYLVLPLVVPALAWALYGTATAAEVLRQPADSGAQPVWLATTGLAAGYTAIFAAAWAATTYGLVPLTRRAIGHAIRDMGAAVSLQGRALPMLLFVTMFLFFTGELWQLMNRLQWWRLTLVLGLFAAVTVLATAARLRDEIDRVEQDLSPPRLEAACKGTPVERAVSSVDPQPRPLGRRQVANVLLGLATRQLVQAAVVGLGLFGFFVLLGVIVVDEETATQWIGAPPAPSVWIPGVPAALLRAAAMLAGFGSMYFAVTSMTDTERRREFFAPIVDEIERILAVRAVYLEVRSRSPGAGT